MCRQARPRPERPQQEGLRLWRGRTTRTCGRAGHLRWGASLQRSQVRVLPGVRPSTFSLHTPGSRLRLLRLSLTRSC